MWLLQTDLPCLGNDNKKGSTRLLLSSKALFYAKGKQPIAKICPF